MHLTRFLSLLNSDDVNDGCAALQDAAKLSNSGAGSDSQRTTTTNEQQSSLLVEYFSGSPQCAEIFDFWKAYPHNDMVTVSICYALASIIRLSLRQARADNDDATPPSAVGAAASSSSQLSLRFLCYKILKTFHFISSSSSSSSSASSASLFTVSQSPRVTNAVLHLLATCAALDAREVFRFLPLQAKRFIGLSLKRAPASRPHSHGIRTHMMRLFVALLRHANRHVFRDLALARSFHAPLSSSLHSDADGYVTEWLSALRRLVLDREDVTRRSKLLVLSDRCLTELCKLQRTRSTTSSSRQSTAKRRRGGEASADDADAASAAAATPPDPVLLKHVKNFLRAACRTLIAPDPTFSAYSALSVTESTTESYAMKNNRALLTACVQVRIDPLDEQFAHSLIVESLCKAPEMLVPWAKMAASHAPSFSLQPRRSTAFARNTALACQLLELVPLPDLPLDHDRHRAPTHALLFSSTLPPALVDRKSLTSGLSRTGNFSSSSSSTSAEAQRSVCRLTLRVLRAALQRSERSLMALEHATASKSISELARASWIDLTAVLREALFKQLPEFSLVRSLALAETATDDFDDKEITSLALTCLALYTTLFPGTVHANQWDPRALLEERHLERILLAAEKKKEPDSEIKRAVFTMLNNARPLTMLGASDWKKILLLFFSESARHAAARRPLAAAEDTADDEDFLHRNQLERIMFNILADTSLFEGYQALYLIIAVEHALQEQEEENDAVCSLLAKALSDSLTSLPPPLATFTLPSSPAKGHFQLLMKYLAKLNASFLPLFRFLLESGGASPPLKPNKKRKQSPAPMESTSSVSSFLPLLSPARQFKRFMILGDFPRALSILPTLLSSSTRTRAPLVVRFALSLESYSLAIESSIPAQQILAHFLSQFVFDDDEYRLLVEPLLQQRLASKPKSPVWPVVFRRFPQTLTDFAEQRSFAQLTPANCSLDLLLSLPVSEQRKKNLWPRLKKQIKSADCFRSSPQARAWLELWVSDFLSTEGRSSSVPVVQILTLAVEQAPSVSRSLLRFLSSSRGADFFHSLESPDPLRSALLSAIEDGYVADEARLVLPDFLQREKEVVSAQSVKQLLKQALSSNVDSAFLKLSSSVTEPSLVSFTLSLCVSHSKFVPTLFAERGEESAEALCSFLLTLFRRVPPTPRAQQQPSSDLVDDEETKRNKRLIIFFMAAYTALATRRVDRMLLELVEMFDQRGYFIAENCFLFGASARSLLRESIEGVVAEQFDFHQSLFSELLDKELLRRTSELEQPTLPPHHHLEPWAASDGVYDARFVLPLLLFAVKQYGPIITDRVFTENYALSTFVAMLSLADESLRQLAYAGCFHIYELMKTAVYASEAATPSTAKSNEWRERFQIYCLLRLLRDSVTESGAQLPRPLTVFVSRGIAILMRPQHRLYPRLCSALLRQPLLPVEELPLMQLELLYSNDERDREWLLETMTLSCNDRSSYKILRYHRLPELLLSCSLSSLLSTSIAAATLRLFQVFCSIPRCCIDLLQKRGFASWLLAAAQFDVDRRLEQRPLQHSQADDRAQTKSALQAQKAKALRRSEPLLLPMIAKCFQLLASHLFIESAADDDVDDEHGENARLLWTLLLTSINQLLISVIHGRVSQLPLPPRPSNASMIESVSLLVEALAMVRRNGGAAIVDEIHLPAEEEALISVIEAYSIWEIAVSDKKSLWLLAMLVYLLRGANGERWLADKFSRLDVERDEQEDLVFQKRMILLWHLRNMKFNDKRYSSLLHLTLPRKRKSTWNEYDFKIASFLFSDVKLESKEDMETLKKEEFSNFVSGAQLHKEIEKRIAM